MRTLTLCLLATACASSASTPGVAGIVVGGATEDGSGYTDWHSGLVVTPIVMGPQGGQHIWVSLRADRAFNPTKMRLTIDMTDLDTGLTVKPGSLPFTRTLEDTGTELRVTGITAYVKEPCAIRGHKVQVRVHAEDLIGMTGDDQATVQPSWSGYCSP